MPPHVWCIIVITYHGCVECIYLLLSPWKVCHDHGLWSLCSRLVHWGHEKDDKNTNRNATSSVEDRFECRYRMVVVISIVIWIWIANEFPARKLSQQRSLRNKWERKAKKERESTSELRGKRGIRIQNFPLSLPHTPFAPSGCFSNPASTNTHSFYI